MTWQIISNNYRGKFDIARDLLFVLMLSIVSILAKIFNCSCSFPLFVNLDNPFHHLTLKLVKCK